MFFSMYYSFFFFFFQAEDGIRDIGVTGVQTCALPILRLAALAMGRDHEAPRDLVGDRRAVVAADDVQAQVDAGRAARGGQHVAIVDEIGRASCRERV